MIDGRTSQHRVVRLHARRSYRIISGMVGHDAAEPQCPAWTELPNQFQIDAVVHAQEAGARRRTHFIAETNEVGRYLDASRRVMHRQSNWGCGGRTLRR